uniref:Putative GHMP kinase family protein n=1 Tax=viral metagenome TaxID=1070528 RepID=A0A6M3KGJ8_9ZZZZ
MIITRAPTRITFGGGGTDIKSYYEHEPGFLIAAGIDKYTWILANRGYYDHIHLKYSSEERVTKVDDIKHGIFREALKSFKWTDPIELVSMADYPVGCGLGTSGSFTVALVKAIAEYIKNPTWQAYNIADHACYIEIDLLKEPIGKQDQFASAYGGLNCYKFEQDGQVVVTPLNVPNVAELEKNLMLFDTRIPRSSAEILTDQVKEMEANGAVIRKLDKTKQVAYAMKDMLTLGNIHDFGVRLNDYWNMRKKFSDKITNPKIDEAYDIALRNGALGGKLQGAGGGGFLLFYCPERHEKLIKALEGVGLKHMPFKFDYRGVLSYVTNGM